MVTSEHGPEKVEVIDFTEEHLPGAARVRAVIPEPERWEGVKNVLEVVQRGAGEGSRVGEGLCEECHMVIIPHHITTAICFSRNYRKHPTTR
jgi:hypothetical protein